MTTLANFSGTRLAPPINPPSISSCAISSLAFFSFMLPPYRMRTLSAIFNENFFAIVFLMNRLPRLGLPEVAVLAVPIAHTGSKDYDMVEVPGFITLNIDDL